MRFSDISKLSGILGIITICLTGCTDSSDNTEPAENAGILQVPEVTITTELDDNAVPSSPIAESSLEEASPQLIVQNFVAARLRELEVAELEPAADPARGHGAVPQGHPPGTQPPTRASL